MKEIRAPAGTRRPATPAFFFAAGGLLAVQVVLMAVRRYGIASFSDLWIAPFAIVALVAALVGLIGLHPGTVRASRMAAASRGTAIAAGAVLCLAALWLFSTALLGGIPQPLPAWFFALVAAFMTAFVLSFLLAAAANLRASGAERTTGYLLLVPVLAWGVMLAFGLSTDFAEALKLDVYTNGFIALAFVGIGYVLRRRFD